MFFRRTDFLLFLFDFLKRALAFRTGPAVDSVAWRPLTRTPAQRRRHTQWVAEQVYLNWLGPYFKAYHFKKTNVTGQGFRVQLLRESGRQGLLLFYDPSIGPGNFQHLFDFIAEQTQELGYNLSTSDQRTAEHPRYRETIYKHFLKPKPKTCTATGRCQQHYGNVTVDLVCINNQPGFIRFFSNPFDDSIFTPAHSFDELLGKIFNQPPADEFIQNLIKAYYKK